MAIHPTLKKVLKTIGLIGLLFVLFIFLALMIFIFVCPGDCANFGIVFFLIFYPLLAIPLVIVGFFIEKKESKKVGLALPSTYLTYVLLNLTISLVYGSNDFEHGTIHAFFLDDET